MNIVRTSSPTVNAISQVVEPGLIDLVLQDRAPPGPSLVQSERLKALHQEVPEVVVPFVHPHLAPIGSVLVRAVVQIPLLRLPAEKVAGFGVEVGEKREKNEQNEK